MRAIEERLAHTDRAQGHRRHRHLRAQRPPCRDRHCRGQGRQDGAVRKAAGPHRGRRQAHGRCGREGRRPQHGLVQLPPRAGGDADQEHGRRGPARHRSSTTAPSSCRTGPSRPTCRRAAPATWRLDVDAAGSGVTGDLLAHCLDTATWINGGISSLTAMTETFIKERKHAETGKVQTVGIDDAAAVLTRFANGSLGTFESTRYARGHKAGYTLEINGEKGSLAWDLHDLNRVQFFDHRRRGRAARLDRYPRHRWRSSLSGQVVGAGSHHRLRAQLHPSGGRLPRRPARAASRRRRPSARRSRPTAICDAILASGKSGSWVSL